MSIQRRLAASTASCAAAFLGFVGLVMTPGCAESMQSAQESSLRSVNSAPAAETWGDQPPTPKTLLSMADILAAQGKDKECESVLSTCIRQHPGFAPAYNSLAELQMRQGRVAEAANVLSGALRRWPSDSVLLNNLGMCSLIARDYETALEYFTRAAAHAPKSDKYRANMATSLGMLGRDPEALALLRQILPEDEALHNTEVLKKARQKAAGSSANITSG
jgi:Flp pilus assembly protein TadD